MSLLIDCTTPYCRAKFNPTVQWVYGWRDPDRTDDNFETSGRIPVGHCPICRKQQISVAAYGTATLSRPNHGGK